MRLNSHFPTAPRVPVRGTSQLLIVCPSDLEKVDRIKAALYISHRAIRGEDLGTVPFSIKCLLCYHSHARITMQLSM